MNIVDEIIETLTDADDGVTIDVSKKWAWGYVTACVGFDIIDELQYNYLIEYIDKHGEDYKPDKLQSVVSNLEKFLRRLRINALHN